MNKKIRQYIGLAVAVLMYYLIHEGAHLLVALAQGVFKQINFMGMGVQIDVYTEQMNDVQMGIFCLMGPVASILTGWLMTVFVQPICRIRSYVVKTCTWYTTLTMLILDPLYLSVYYRWVGGGDMNGIALLFPETMVSIIAAAIAIVNAIIIWKVLYPNYQKAFHYVNQSKSI